MSGLLTAIDVSSRGLTLQRAKMNAVAENIANAETTETSDGGPYRRKQVVANEAKLEQQPFRSMLKQADTNLARTHRLHRSGKSPVVTSREKLTTVDMEEVQAPASDFQLVYDPSHPNANDEGYVKMPDIEIINEMVDMMAATRAYEANTVAIASAKSMAEDALDI